MNHDRDPYTIVCGFLFVADTYIVYSVIGKSAQHTCCALFVAGVDQLTAPPNAFL